MSTIKLSACAAMLLAAVLATPAHAATSDADYKAGKDRISADYKTDKAACDGMSGNAKDICVEQAKGKEMVAKAELEYAHSGKMADGNKVAVAKADAAYAVAKEKCDDLSGNPKDVCVKEAKAAHVKGLAEAKASKQTADARSDASKDVRDADYKFAAEKCESLAGDPKATCMQAAKAKYGKS